MLVKRMPSLDFKSGAQYSIPAESAWIQCRLFPALMICSLQRPTTASASPSSCRISLLRALSLVIGTNFTFGAADCNQAIRSGLSTRTRIFFGGFQPLTNSRTGLSLSCKPNFATVLASPGSAAGGELGALAAWEAPTKAENTQIVRQMPPSRNAVLLGRGD